MLQSHSSLFSLSNSTDVTLSGSLLTNNSVVAVPAGCVLKRVSSFLPWDHEDNLVPKQAEVIANIVCTGVLLPLLFLVSFSTNMINMVVFCKQGVKERINMCLFTLSLLDWLYVTLVYCYNSDVMYMFALGKGDEIGPSNLFLARHYLFGMPGLAASSQVLSGVIALERCLCITRPLLVKRLLSTQKTVMLLWPLVLTVTAGSAFVVGVRYTPVCVFDPEDSTTAFNFYPRPFYLRHQVVLDFMYSVVYGLFLPGLCVTCVIVCTAVTASKMKKLSQWRETVSSVSQSLSTRDLAVTRMIVGTSLFFIACIVPSFVLRISFSVVPDLKFGRRYHNLYSVFLGFYHLASTINCTFNFFIYYVCGSKFRETVHQLCVSYCRMTQRGQSLHVSHVDK